MNQSEHPKNSEELVAQQAGTGELIDFTKMPSWEKTDELATVRSGLLADFQEADFGHD